jgi:two-component system chemotaxis response regulator CheY
MDTHPLKILIAEDDSSQRDLLATLLRKRFQCDVLQAEDGLEALRIMLKDCPDLDLVILDLTIPYIDGLQILSMIKNHHHLHELPVIVCTARSAQDLVAEILRYGVAGFMLKPISKPILYDKVTAALQKCGKLNSENSKRGFLRTKQIKCRPPSF